MSTVNIQVDDVLVVTKMMSRVIETKRLQPEEYRQVSASWERLVDVMSRLQRKQNLDKLYPPTPVQQPAPSPVPVVPEVPATSSAVGAEGDPVTVESVPEPVSIPTEPTNVEGSAEPGSEPIPEVSENVDKPDNENENENENVDADLSV